MNVLLELFLCFAKIGLFTFGGGYAMIAIIENTCVEQKKWLTHDEMMDIAVIAESTPGPIMIILATGLYMMISHCFSKTSVDGRALLITVVLAVIVYVLPKFKIKKPSPILLIILSACVGVVVYGV